MAMAAVAIATRGGAMKPATRSSRRASLEDGEAERGHDERRLGARRGRDQRDLVLRSRARKVPDPARARESLAVPPTTRARRRASTSPRSRTRQRRSGDRRRELFEGLREILLQADGDDGGSGQGIAAANATLAPEAEWNRSSAITPALRRQRDDERAPGRGSVRTSTSTS
jgi:hypothetical protein